MRSCQNADLFAPSCLSIVPCFLQRASTGVSFPSFFFLPLPPLLVEGQDRELTWTRREEEGNQRLPCPLASSGSLVVVLRQQSQHHPVPIGQVGWHFGCCLSFFGTALDYASASPLFPIPPFELSCAASNCAPHTFKLPTSLLTCFLPSNVTSDVTSKGKKRDQVFCDFGWRR